MQGYHAMFHAARALLFSVGYRETSHYCLAVAIEALYVGTGKLGREQYVYLYAAMGMRANADYRIKFSEESARLIVKRAEKNSGCISPGLRPAPQDSFVEKSRQVDFTHE